MSANCCRFYTYVHSCSAFFFLPCHHAVQMLEAGSRVPSACIVPCIVYCGLRTPSCVVPKEERCGYVEPWVVTNVKCKLPDCPSFSPCVGWRVACGVPLSRPPVRCRPGPL